MRDSNEDKGKREWEQRISRIEKYVRTKDNGELRELEKAGIPKEVVLTLLALSADGGDLEPLKYFIRVRQSELTRLAGQMTKLADKLESIVNSPMSQAKFWARHVAGWGTLGMPEPQSLSEGDPAVPFIVAGIRVLARRLEEEGERFGWFLRSYGRVNTGVVLLLVRCWQFRIKTPAARQLSVRRGRFLPTLDCLDQLAWLLTYAFEAAGRPKKFSADRLRMIFARHGRPMIGRWFRYAGPLAKTEPPGRAYSPVPHGYSLKSPKPTTGTS